MSTTLNIKDEVVTQLGKNNATVDDVKRDVAIKKGKRKFYNSYPFSFTRKRDEITFTNGEASFPEDFNSKFVPKIYQVVGLLKREFKAVPLEDVDSYSTDVYVFAVDKVSKKIYSNIDGTFKFIYQIAVPYDLDNEYEEPCDDISAIVNISIAIYWLSAERNDDMYKQFMGDYERDRLQIIKDDRLNEPVRRIKHDGVDYGYGA